MRWDLYDFLTTAAGNLDLLVHDAGEAQENRIKRATPDLLFPVNAWTPVFTNLNVGNGLLSGRYIKIARLVVFDGQLIFGSATSVSGGVSIALPVAADSYGAITVIGKTRYRDVSTGSAAQLGVVQNTGSLNVTSTSGVYATNATVDTTIPFTWAVNDELSFSGAYFAAE